jgi:hypothetical protein
LMGISAHLRGRAEGPGSNSQAFTRGAAARAGNVAGAREPDRSRRGRERRALSGFRFTGSGLRSSRGSGHGREGGGSQKAEGTPVGIAQYSGA